MLGVNTVVTFITALAVALIAFLSRESYSEMRLAHDDILTVKLLMVHRGEFDIAIAEIKASQKATETALMQLRSRQNQFEIDVQRLKEKVK